MTRFLTLGVLSLLAFVPSVRGEGPEDRFVRIYNLIQQADALTESGRDDKARQQYLEAQAELKALRKEHPDWNESVVGFRLKYVAEKLEQATQNDTPAALPLPGKKSVSPVATDDAAGLLQLLQEQVRQLAADKELLQARLKEALTAQPAAVDPRELARAAEKNKALQKEVEVLKINLEKAESIPDKPVDPAVLAETRRALAAAGQKVAQQSETVATLALERDALQKRLQTFIDGIEVRTLRDESESLKRQVTDLRTRAEAGAKADEWKQQLGVLQTVLTNQKARTDALAAEKKIVDERLNGLMARHEAELTAKTRALETELAEAKTAAQTNAAVVSALQAALQASQRARAEVEKHGREIEASLAEAQAALAAGRAAGDNRGKSGPDPERIQRLERERDELQKELKLAASNAGAHHSLAVIYATQRPPALELARWHYQKALEGGLRKDPNLEKMLKR